MSNRDPESYYASLGLTPDASAEDIRAAFRRLVKDFHPDSNPAGDANVGWFARVTEAYKTLGNPARKATYDKSTISSAPNPAAAARPAAAGDDDGTVFPEIRVSDFRSAGVASPQHASSKWGLAFAGLTIAALAGFGLYLFSPKTGPVSYATGTVFSDCSSCPDMVALPQGTFEMGAPPEAQAAGQMSSPQHTVSISRPFAIGKFEVTSSQYAAFLDEMIRQGRFDQRWVATNREESHLLWRVTRVLVEPGFDGHPVIDVSWRGAKAYVQWLAIKTGYKYRLPTEAEWEYAARAGSQTKFYFGDNAMDGCEYGNIPDYSRLKDHANWIVVRCTDGYSETGPVGKFKPNAFGLYDTIGNAWEWVEDCWHGQFDGAPTDGLAWLSGGDCSKRVIRGASFDALSIALGVADRRFWDANGQLQSIGFRVARDLGP